MSELKEIPSLEGALLGIPIIYGELSEVVAYQSYVGDYRIVPLFGQDINLKTENKVLKENVVVKQIPYFETPTPEGGTTIYIGTEV